LVRVAKAAGADAVHPGYGFLAENAAFAEACAAAGLVFIGPPPPAIRALGDKTAARRIARELGVPTVPGTFEPVAGEAAVRAAAREIGYPLMIKASMGGGGKGMRAVHAESELIAALGLAQSEAAYSFGDGGGLRRRGHGRVPRRRRSELLLPRDEHAAAGRARRDGDGDRHRPRPRAAPARRRRAARVRAGGREPARRRDRVPDQRRGSIRRLDAVAGH